MLSLPANMQTIQDAYQKGPVYLVHFDGEAVDYATAAPGSPDNTVKEYLDGISGRQQQVKPEEGRATIGAITFGILDVDDEITALWKTDAAYFHRKKTTVKAGYMGLDEADFQTVFTGWVTGKKLSDDGLKYLVTITDPKKWLQKKIFRDASEASPRTFSGNPINLVLMWILSTGNKTNGSYDLLPANDSIGLDESLVDVAGIEHLRDVYFPAASHDMSFSITESEKASDFFEKEIFRELNIYPVIDGQGRFTLKKIAPPLPTDETLIEIGDDDIIGVPKWDENLDGMINEIECSYDHDGDDFQTTDIYVDSDTFSGTRGPGSEPLKIESRGFDTDLGSAAVLERRAKSIFERFSPPPIKIQIKTFFRKWHLEAGDIISFSSSFLPDLEAGTRGISGKLMEITDLNVDWRGGSVNMTLLYSGFTRGTYQVIAPTMTVLSATSSTEFTVSLADAAKFDIFTNPEILLNASNMVNRAGPFTLTGIDTDTGVIDSDDLGVTPDAGDIIVFADYDDCTATQQLYGFVANSSDELGAAPEDAHLISP